jgi:hypothetical protein
MNANVDLSVVTYGEVSHSIDSLPAATLHAFVRRGMAHYYGNEISARLSQAKAKRAADPELGPMNDAELVALEASLISEAKHHALQGTIGTTRGGPRGPRGTGIETEFNRLCETKARDLMKAAGFVLPSGDKTITLANGDTLTRSDIIARVKVRYGEVLRTEAEAAIARRNREAAALATKGAQSLEDLGL